MQSHEDLVEFGTRRWLIVVGVMSATLLQVLDATIVNVALPTIQGNLGANFDDGAWIITGYIIAAVIVIPLTPWLQQLLGRRNYYVGAIIGFTITSGLCGTATSLICVDHLSRAARPLRWRLDRNRPGDHARHVPAATTRPQSGVDGDRRGRRTVDRPDARRRPHRLALLELDLLRQYRAGHHLGDSVRNALTRSRRGGKVQGFDGVGLALLAIGLASLQYVLDEGERYDWFSDRNIALTAVVGVAALAIFVYWELRVVKNPIVDIGILMRKPVVAVGCVLAAVLAFSLFGGVILAPQFQQLLLNFTATLSGLSILCRALGIMVMTFVTLALMNRFKIKPQILLAIGFILVVIANFQTAAVLTTNSVFGTFVFPLVLGGIGFGMIFVPLSVTVLSSVQGFDTQKATSLQNLCQQLGGSISTAVLVTLLDRRGAFHQDHLAASINLASPAVQRALQAHAPLTAVAAQVSQQATTLAFADAFYFLGVVTLILTPLVLLAASAQSRGAGSRSSARNSR